MWARPSYINHSQARAPSSNLSSSTATEYSQHSNLFGTVRRCTPPPPPPPTFTLMYRQYNTAPLTKNTPTLDSQALTGTVIRCTIFHRTRTKIMRSCKLPKKNNVRCSWRADHSTARDAPLDRISTSTRYFRPPSWWAPPLLQVKRASPRRSWVPITRHPPRGCPLRPPRGPSRP